VLCCVVWRVVWCGVVPDQITEKGVVNAAGVDTTGSFVRTPSIYLDCMYVRMYVCMYVCMYVGVW